MFKSARHVDVVSLINEVLEISKLNAKLLAQRLMKFSCEQLLNMLEKKSDPALNA